MKALLVAPAILALVYGGAAAAQTAPAAAFARADVNNDGRLSRVEFDAAREAMFQQVDANGDGRLTMSELRAQRPAGAPQRRPSSDQIQKLRALDRNSDRAIDINEFRATSGERFASADQNRDGWIDRNETAAFISALGVGG